MSGYTRYVVTVFLSAFLLFQLQPLIGKYILPWFGGTPAVWATCLLFFQVLLLLGYAYAHFLSSRLSLRAQGSVHLVLLIASLALMGLLLWLLLPTCSSMMLVAGTNQICQEVAVIPFLWVLPLTLYLSTWMLLGCCLAPAGRR